MAEMFDNSYSGWNSPSYGNENHFADGNAFGNSQAFDAREDFGSVSPGSRRNRRAGFAGQIRIYTGKCFRVFVHQHKWINFLSTLIIMGIIITVMNDRTFVEFSPTHDSVFVMICACLWIGLFNSIQSICAERKIIKREHRAGLNLLSYVLAHVLYEIFLCAVEGVLIEAVMYLRNADHFPAKGVIMNPLIEMYISIFLTLFAADMLALMISCIVRNPNVAMTVMPFVLIFQLVMSGTIFKIGGKPGLMAVSAATVSRWGYAAAFTTCNTEASVKNGSQSDLRDPDFIAGYDDMILTGDDSDDEKDNAAMPTRWILDDCDPVPRQLFKNWGLLLGYSAVYVLLGTAFLRLVDKDRR